MPLQQELAPAEAGRAPGIDSQDFADIEAYGVERWLAELALALRQEGRIVIRPTRGQRHIALARRRYARRRRYIRHPAT